MKPDNSASSDPSESSSGATTRLGSRTDSSMAARHAAISRLWSGVVERTRTTTPPAAKATLSSPLPSGHNAPFWMPSRASSELAARIIASDSLITSDDRPCIRARAGFGAHREPDARQFKPSLCQLDELAVDQAARRTLAITVEVVLPQDAHPLALAGLATQAQLPGRPIPAPLPIPHAPTYSGNQPPSPSEFYEFMLVSPIRHTQPAATASAAHRSPIAPRAAPRWAAGSAWSRRSSITQTSVERLASRTPYRQNGCCPRCASP